MTRDELNKYLCAILTTIDEVEYSPESILYIGLGMDMSKWDAIRGILLAGGLATIDCSQVRITPKGHNLAQQINAFMATR
jgi:hypothetical protein